MELNSLIKAALNAAGQNAAISLKNASEQATGYSAFDQTFFKDGMTIQIPEDVDKVWIPYANGTGFYTLMEGNDPDQGVVPVNVGFKTLFRRVSYCDKNGVVQRGLLQNEGTFQEYRHQAPTLQDFWNLVKGKKMTITKVQEVITPVYDPEVRYHAGDTVPEDKRSTMSIWKIDIE